MINRAVYILDFSTVCKTMEMQEWILSFLNSHSVLCVETRIESSGRHFNPEKFKMEMYACLYILIYVMNLISVMHVHNVLNAHIYTCVLIGLSMLS